ncbi:MAG: MerR family transcriptional regulator [Chloroflexi bacterium]|nr:MAG: MerR family transcriptional regulator [Chloroflexota bacterium]
MGSTGEQPVYSIGAVAHMLEVPASTLRAWEERYGVVVPTRSGGSQRLYSRNQLELLRFVKRKIDSGMSAADAHRVLSQELELGRLPTDTEPEAEELRPLILIAERDSYAAQLSEYFLRTEGYQVATALDAIQARLQFEERSPDLVVLDLLISGGAGFRLCREFTARVGTRVLALSALDSAEEALQAGASAFLNKPIEPLQLVSTVRDLMGTSALARSAGKAASKARVK